MSKNSKIKLISASIDDELLLVELMKKYHLYDVIEKTDEDRLAELITLLSSSEKGKVWIICLGSKQIGYIA
ncbi:hypothetical protein ACV334_37610, partial [Pseudomonas aeruginosa]